MLVKRCRCDMFAARIDLLDDLMHQTSLRIGLIQAIPHEDLILLNHCHSNMIEVAHEANLFINGIDLDDAGTKTKEEVLDIANAIWDALEDEYIRIDELWIEALAK